MIEAIVIVAALVVVIVLLNREPERRREPVTLPPPSMCEAEVETMQERMNERKVAEWRDAGCKVRRVR